MENQKLFNKSGTEKKIQDKKTKNKKEYMKNYFINSQDKICDICETKYKISSHKRHINGIKHKLKLKIKELEEK